MIEKGETKPNKLHRAATHYVSAKAQAFLIQQMLQENLLTENEELYYRRGRNAKSHTSAKNADITTYRVATGFEALMGYLHLTKQTERMEELINWCIEKVGETHEERK
ncbi:RNAase [Enterococcus mundtii]|nr:RNAase [Enterococcus mundtii]